MNVDNGIRVIVKNRLIQCRKENNITQKELAEKIGLKTTTVASWEQGLSLPSPDMLYWLSELYGKSIGFMYGDEKELGTTNNKKEDEMKRKPTNEEYRSRERILYLIENECNGSQQVFADRCGIGKSSVSQYVHGASYPSGKRATQIAEAFHVDPLWVMGYDTNIEPDFRMDEDVFAQNLRRYIELSGIEQHEVADRLNVDRAVFNSWCHAVPMPDASTVRTIAHFFNIEVSDLLEERKVNYIPESYCVNDDAKKLAGFIDENPGYKVLFDTVCSVHPEDIELVAELLKRFKTRKEE